MNDTGASTSPADALASHAARPPLRAEPITLPLGLTIDRFELIRQIGSGGFGRVYEARQLDETSQHVALKVIDPDFLPLGTAQQRIDEARTLGMLRDRNIVKVHGAGFFAYPTDGSILDLPWIAMQLLGPSVTEYVSKYRPSFEKRLELLAGIVEGVSAAHSREPEIFHGDIKPSNVLMDGEGDAALWRPQLIDFGLAVSAGASESRGYSVAYAAPEQLEGMPPSTTSDVYSLGVLAYLIVAESLPYQMPDREYDSTADEATQRAWRRVASIHSLRSMRGPHPRGGERVRALDAVLRTALSSDSGHRHPNAGQLLDDLRNILLGNVTSAYPRTGIQRVRYFGRRHRVSLMIVASLLLGLVGTTAFAIRSQLFAHDERVARREQESQTYLASIRGAASSIRLGEARQAQTHLARCPTSHHAAEYQLLERLADSSTTVVSLPALGTTVRFSPDDRLVAAASIDGTVLVCDTTTGAEVVRFRTTIGTPDRIVSIAIQEHGQIAIVGRSGILDIWSIASGRASRAVAYSAKEGTNEAVYLLSTDGTLLARRTVNAFAMIDVREHRILWTADVPMTYSGERGIAFSGDSSLVAIDVERSTIDPQWGLSAPTAQLKAGLLCIHDARSGTLKEQIPLPLPSSSLEFGAAASTLAVNQVQIDDRGRHETTVIRINRDHSTLAPSHLQHSVRHVIPVGAAGIIATSEGFLTNKDVATGQEVCLSGHTGPIIDCAANTTRTKLATVAGDQTLRLWNLQPSAFSLREQPPSGATILTSDGRTVVTASIAMICAWNTRDTINMYIEQDRIHREGEEWFRKASVAIPGYDPSRYQTPEDLLTAYDSQTHQQLWQTPLDGHILDLDAADQGLVAAITLPSNGPKVGIWQNGSPLICPTIDGVPTSICVGPDRKLVAIGSMPAADASSTSTIVVANVTTGDIVSRLQAPPQFVRSLSFSPHGERIACCSANAEAFVWDTARGKLIQRTRLQLGDSGVMRVHFWNSHRLILATVKGLYSWELAPFSEPKLIWDAGYPIEIVGSEETERLFVRTFLGGVSILTGSGVEILDIPGEGYGAAMQHFSVLRGLTWDKTGRWLGADTLYRFYLFDTKSDNSALR